MTADASGDHPGQAAIDLSRPFDLHPPDGQSDASGLPVGLIELVRRQGDLVVLDEAHLDNGSEHCSWSIPELWRSRFGGALRFVQLRQLDGRPRYALITATKPSRTGRP